MRVAIGRYVHSMRALCAAITDGCMHSLNIYMRHTAAMRGGAVARQGCNIVGTSDTDTHFVKMLSVYLPLRRGPHFIAALSKYCQHNIIWWYCSTSVRLRRAALIPRPFNCEKIFLYTHFSVRACTHSHSRRRCREQWKLCLGKKIISTAIVFDTYVWMCFV